METKFKLNFLLKNSIRSIFKSNGSNNLKNLFSLAKQFTFKKTNLFLLLNSALFFTYLKKSKNFLFSAPNEELKSLSLEDRMNVVQYSANTPVEDRFNAVELKNIQGNLLAVFDGHGGDSTADYASEKMASYLDSIYLELTKMPKNKDKSKDELITQALFDTFHKIVNFKKIFFF